ncbi:hypothetical protein ACHAW6_001054, partial [Cyclotella cf. meneghiniana]
HPLTLPDCCDGCGEGFTVEHGLNCKNVALLPFVMMTTEMNRPTCAPSPSPALKSQSSPSFSMVVT